MSAGMGLGGYSAALVRNDPRVLSACTVWDVGTLPKMACVMPSGADPQFPMLGDATVHWIE